MFVCRSAMTRGGEEIVLGNNADGTGMCSRRRHEAEYSIDEAPVSVEECRASVNEMLPSLCCLSGLCSIVFAVVA